MGVANAPRAFHYSGMMPGLFHGYTYSGHPVAAAAGLATLDEYEAENLFSHAAQMAPLLEDAVHTLVDVPGGKECLADVRNYGCAAVWRSWSRILPICLRRGSIRAQRRSRWRSHRDVAAAEHHAGGHFLFARRARAKLEPHVATALVPRNGIVSHYF